MKQVLPPAEEPTFPEQADPITPRPIYCQSLTGKEVIWIPWTSILNFDEKGFHGVLTVKACIGNALSDPVKVTVSGVDSRFWPLVLALAVSVAILLIPVAIVWNRSYMVDDLKIGVVKTLFLDQETNTYSLSKCQLYLWTVVGIFGYEILTISQSLVQGKFVFSDIPNGLPGIIAISGTTTALAQTASTLGLQKASGPIHPSFADFITVGGFVAPERLQFFLWTIIGSVTFLFLLIFSDPAQLSTLPTIPEGFLAVSGASSLVYLGGKLARKAGPNIETVSVLIDPTTLILTAKGRNLSKLGSFNIDGKEIGSQGVVITTSLPEGDPTGEFFQQVVIKITNPDAAYLSGGKRILRITNGDGQNAECYYQVPIPEVTTVTASFVVPTLTLVVVGRQLSKEATFKIDTVGITVQTHGLTISGQDPEDPVNSPLLFRKLILTIAQPNPKWIVPNAYKFDLSNTPTNPAQQVSYTLP